MTEVKFTAGPWNVSEAKTVDGEIMVLGGYGFEFGLIAAVTEAEDARLIAAAPEMLEALNATLADFVAWSEIRGGAGTYQPAMDRISAAIAKAKGNQ